MYSGRTLDFSVKGNKEVSNGDKEVLNLQNRNHSNPALPTYPRASTSRLGNKEASNGDKEVLNLQNRNHNNPALPTYPRASTSRFPYPAMHRHNAARDKTKRRDYPLNIPCAQPIKLHQSENAWKPLRKIEQIIELSPEELEREKLKRNVQGVLNKLTFQKFKILLAQLKTLNIYTENEMDIVADLIYENAISEPHFSVLYANLCMRLAMVNISVTEHSVEKVDFATLLLTKCQKGFEEYCSSPNQEEFKVLNVGDPKLLGFKHMSDVEEFLKHSESDPPNPELKYASSPQKYINSPTEPSDATCDREQENPVEILTQVPQEGKPFAVECELDFKDEAESGLDKNLSQMQASENEKREELQLNSEEKKKVRARRTGNIRFIGELFKLKMILKPVLHECIEILLMKQDEESLEYLCLLIKTAGKELESHDDCSETQDTDEYFTQIQKIVDERSTSTRIRFLLQDILDLKVNNWVPRRTENIPRTIDEIHKEAALEARKQWRWYQNMLLLATQHEKPDQRNNPTCHNTCMCEDKVPTSTKSKKGSSCVLNQAGSNLDTLDEAKNILLAEGRRGQKKSDKGRSKQKNSQRLRK